MSHENCTHRPEGGCLIGGGLINNKLGCNYELRHLLDADLFVRRCYCMF